MPDPARLLALMERRSRLTLGRLSAELARAHRTGEEAAALETRLAALLADQRGDLSAAAEATALQRNHAQLSRLTEASEIARNRAAHAQAEVSTLRQSAAAESHRRDRYAEAAARARLDAEEAAETHRDTGIPWRRR